MLFRRLASLSLVCLFGITCVYAMQVERWTAHTSARRVVALSAAEDVMWAASSGGVFSYAPATGEVERYTVTEGLHDVQTRAIAYDAVRRVVWIGYVDGVLGRIDLETGEVDTFFDIQRSERFPSSDINRLRMSGDSLLVATSFGLVIFDPVRLEVRDTYSQVGSFTPAIAVHDMLVAPLPTGAAGLWLATDEGMAYAELGMTNLRDPSVWSVESISSFRAGEMYAIAMFQGKLYVGTNRGLYRRDTENSYTQYGFTDRRIVDLVPLSDRLLAIDQFKLYAAFSSGGSLVQAEGFLELNALVVGPDGTLWLGDTETGLNQFAQPTGNDPPSLISGEIFPEGPFDSPFGDLVVDSRGALWATAVESVSGAGFYRLDADGGWTNFTGRFRSELVGRSNFQGIHGDAQGNTWVASRGDGIVQVSGDDDTVTIYDHTNSSLQPAAGEVDFVIVGGVDSDEDGRVWVTNTSASMPLHVRTPDGEWTGLSVPRCSGLAPTTALGPLFIDSFGLKWIMVLERGNFRLTAGLLVLDTGTTPTDPSDDVCQFFGQRGSGGLGLPSNRILTITEDRSGRIWVGTEQGLAIFLGSSIAATDSQLEASWPTWADRTMGQFVLLGLLIHDVAVDPSDGVWVATDEGVYLLEDNGGYTLRQRFTAENSPLFSNVVTTIAVDGETGHVYFGTDKGLMSYLGDAINPAPQKRDLFIYPNPVRISEQADPNIYIEGLVEETEIRVIAVHGETVVSFQARGGKALWDGRDRDRQLVPSGVYLVVAIGQNGEGAAVGKVAVIR